MASGKKCDVLVVGGGPAGLRAAEVTSASGLDTVLVDRMASVGRKFLLAGRGGLNITNSKELPRFLARYADGNPGSPLVFVEELRAATEKFNLRRAAEGMAAVAYFWWRFAPGWTGSSP